MKLANAVRLCQDRRMDKVARMSWSEPGSACPGSGVFVYINDESTLSLVDQFADDWEVCVALQIGRRPANDSSLEVSIELEALRLADEVRRHGGSVADAISACWPDEWGIQNKNFIYLGWCDSSYDLLTESDILNLIQVGYLAWFIYQDIGQHL